MARINVPNNTRMPIYVGSTMIPAGESRDFEENDVPLHLRPKKEETPPAPPPPPDPVAELSAMSVKDIQAAIGAGALSDEDLERLAVLELERDKDARKTVLAAIDEERLKRAAAANAGDGAKS